MTHALTAPPGDLTGVELARPGVWLLASGKTEFTAQMLRDAADFYAATGGQAVPIALGHGDGRFSGDPAFGSVTNVRYAEDDRGPVLLGDLVDMPEWLAASAPKRWPNRSVEGFQNFEHDGRNYGLILTGLAFLGATPPGVKNIRSLRDLQTALAASSAQFIVAMAPEEAVDEVSAAGSPMDYTGGMSESELEQQLADLCGSLSEDDLNELIALADAMHADGGN